MQKPNREPDPKIYQCRKGRASPNYWVREDAEAQSPKWLIEVGCIYGGNDDPNSVKAFKISVPMLRELRKQIDKLLEPWKKNHNPKSNLKGRKRIKNR